MIYTAFNTETAKQATHKMTMEFIILRQLPLSGDRYDKQAVEFLRSADTLIRLHRDWNDYGGVMNHDDSFYGDDLNLPDGWMAPVGNTTEVEDLIQKFYNALNRDGVRFPSMNRASEWLRLETAVKELSLAFGRTVIL